MLCFPSVQNVLFASASSTVAVFLQTYFYIDARALCYGGVSSKTTLSSNLIVIRYGERWVDYARLATGSLL